MVAVGLTDSLPLVALVPLQPPAAVQLVTLVPVQVKVLEPPGVIEVGAALKVSVGVGPVTVIRRLRLTVPLAPLQVRL